jgi:ATP-binding cassette subfamily B (MDR/TAP) protein 1
MAALYSQTCPDAFRSLVTKDVGFFDDDLNSPGELAEFLASKVTLVETLFGETINNVVKSASTIAVSLAVIFIWGQWQLALLALAVLPILSLSAMSRTKSSGSQRNSKAASEAAGGKTKSETFEKVGKDDSKTAGAIIGEVVLGVRTVVSFNAQQHFLAAYSQRVLLVAKKARARHMVSAVSVALLEGITPPLIALMVWYGTWLSSVGAMGDVTASGSTLCSGGLSTGMEIIERIMVPMMVTFYASTSIGSTLGNMTGFTEAAEAASVLFQRLDAVSERHPLSEAGLTPPSTNGSVDVCEVSFAYPSAPDRLVCRACTLHIHAGQVCALVGPSGCGKSTIIQLLERFYDPQAGAVKLDGVDVRELNLRWLRSQLGLVGQEPVLFMGTVGENIAYGKPGASQEEVEASARMANAHAFITQSLGDGYATQVGLRGGKVRVSLACAAHAPSTGVRSQHD